MPAGFPLGVVDDLSVHHRDGAEYYVYHDPGPPPSFRGPLADRYKWGFSLVALWSSQLSSEDGVLIDIAPSGIGNIRALPRRFEEHVDFYSSGAGGPGHGINPATGKAYEPQLVPRGDYLRVLAEFRADGPDSETPPGHWFVILNTVSDHELHVRRLGGEGPELDAMEWDVKAYFALGGAMHDAADQCSLSRIWGGIHPPADDTPGRLIGAKVGLDAFSFAKSYFRPLPLRR